MSAPEGTPGITAAVRAEPPPGSTAGETVVHYHFPVEIEVSAGPEALSAHDIVAVALRRLTEGLESR